MDPPFLRVIFCGLYCELRCSLCAPTQIQHAELLWVCAKQECVPVLLSDHVELPFQDVVDYTQISIKWPSTHIGTELLDYLESIPG